MLLVLLTNSRIYSQKITSNLKGDTSLTFSINQGRFLLKESVKVKELTEEKSLYQKLYENQKKEIAKQRTVIVNDSLSKIDLSNANKKTEEKFTLEKGKYDAQVKENKELSKEVTKQKVYKWITIIISAAVVVYETYTIVIKK